MWRTDCPSETIGLLADTHSGLSCSFQCLQTVHVQLCMQLYIPISIYIDSTCTNCRKT